MAARRTKRSKRTATSDSGRKYERNGNGKWVQVVAYRRTKPTRKGKPADSRANFCSSTRKKKLNAPPKRRRKK